MEKHQIPTHWAFRILLVGFTVAPILSGLDKFTNLLTTLSKECLCEA